MHHVRFDVVQQPLIVRDHDITVFRRPELIHTFRHDTQSVDVQSGVRFIEDAQTRFQHGHLEYLVALLLAAAEPFVHTTARQLIVQLHHFTPFAHQLQELPGRQSREPPVFTPLIHGRAHEIHHTHPRNLHRILEREEQPLMTAVLRTELQQIPPQETYAAPGHLKGRMARKHTAQRTLARPVRPHDGMYLTLIHIEIYTSQNLFPIDTCVQVPYL